MLHAAVRLKVLQRKLTLFVVEWMPEVLLAPGAFGNFVVLALWRFRPYAARA